MSEPFVPSRPHRFVLLGRDGVINRRVPSDHLTSWEQFEFLPRALAALRLLADNGYAALVISNQACVGEKLLTTAHLESITQRFLTEVALAGGNIKQVYYCVHRAKDNCTCRLPQTGCIHRAQLDFAFVPHTTHFVGDSPDHLRAAASAGCPTILLQRDAFLAPHTTREAQPPVASDLYEAASMIVAQDALSALWPKSSAQSTDSSRYFHAHQKSASGIGGSWPS